MGKVPTFFVMNTTVTTHPFGYSRFIDFRETWQEYVNPCAGESFRSEILKIFLLSSHEYICASRRQLQ